MRVYNSCSATGKQQHQNSPMFFSSATKKLPASFSFASFFLARRPKWAANRNRPPASFPSNPFHSIGKSPIFSPLVQQDPKEEGSNNGCSTPHRGITAGSEATSLDEQSRWHPQHEPHAESNRPDIPEHLAKLLPSGTMSFQLLAPTPAKQGHCGDMDRMMTGGLMVLCALSCFDINFTDGFRDEKGKVRYGFATFKGLWVIDAGAPLDPHAAVEYRIQFLDFVHAIVSAMIFVAVALFDQNVVSWFYPIPSEDTKQVLTTLPVAIGVLGSMLCVSFLTTHHGIGFPLSPQ